MPQIKNEAKLIAMLARERKQRTFNAEVEHGRKYLEKYPDSTEQLKQDMFEAGLARGLDLYEANIGIIMAELEGI